MSMFSNLRISSNALLKRFLVQGSFKFKKEQVTNFSSNMDDEDEPKSLEDLSLDIPVKEISIPIPYGQLFAKAWGREYGHPVLALHGWMDNCGTFDRLIPLLDTNLFVVALDFPGHGFSCHKPPGCFYEHLDMIASIHYVARHLDWQKFHLIGHSMSGKLAQEYAALYTDAVDKLVVLDTIKVVSFPPEQISNVMVKSIKTNIDIENKLVQSPPVYSIESARQKLMAKMHGEVTLKSADALLKRGARLSKCGKGYIFTRDLRLQTAEYLNAFSHDVCKPLLSRIKNEMLLIRATNTHPAYISSTIDFNLKFLDVFRENCKHFVLETVEGNHFVHLNNPERVAPLINKFFSYH